LNFSIVHLKKNEEQEDTEVINGISSAINIETSNMDQFPKLEGSQVALILAQHSTGIVLDETYKRVNVEENPDMYLIFEDVSKVQEYINSRISSASDVEFVVYDKNQKVIIYIPPPGSGHSEEYHF